MNLPALNTAETFVPLKYRIATGTGPQEVEGYAFETPGWPEWHACVRQGSRYGDSIFSDWIVDHYETGLGLSVLGTLKRKEDAPAAMAQFLNGKGRETVLKRLRMEDCA